MFALSVAGLVDDLAERVQTYAEQQWGQSLSLANPALDGDLCSWFEVGSFELLMKAVRVLLILYSSKHSRIHE